MFEVILQTQPDDYQSLEILKEAYAKVGRKEDSLKTSRRLAEAYFNSGSYTMAMQECEAILVKEPNAPEILAMLGDIETRLQNAGKEIAAGKELTTGPKTGLIARTKFAYVPLEYYDVDRQIPRMLPDHLTLGRLFLPFDLISRTIMIACCNPFDAAGRDAVQQSLDYTVTWYLARPGSIIKALQDVYRLESRA